MKSLGEFESAGSELYNSFAAATIGTEVEGRQVVYYAVGLDESGSHLILQRGYCDDKAPYVLEPVDLKDVLGGMAYALWEKDPNSVEALHLPEAVDLLVQAVALKRQRVLAEIAMVHAILNLHRDSPQLNLAHGAVSKEAKARRERVELGSMYNQYVESHKVRA